MALHKEHLHRFVIVIIEVVEASGLAPHSGMTLASVVAKTDKLALHNSTARSSKLMDSCKSRKGKHRFRGQGVSWLAARITTTGCSGFRVRGCGVTEGWK